MNEARLILQHLSLVLAVIGLLVLSGFFSASETAYFSLPRSAAAAMAAGTARERTAARLLADPRMLLVTILFGNLLVNIAATSAVTEFAIRLFGEAGMAIAVACMTAAIVIVGEIVPKSLAMRDARSTAGTAAPLLGSLMVLFTPFRLALAAIADATVEASRRLFGERGETYGARELATAVEMGHREGFFGEFERDVLTNLFLFSETTAREIVTPRLDVFALDVETPLAEAVVRVRSRGHSRVPVYEGSSDNIVGILDAKDLLRVSRDDRIEIRDIMHPAAFVPEGKRIRDLFGELVAQHRHMVIVVDEHGSYTGLLTREDILEEIFGEIRNPREARVEEYHRLGENRIVVEGSVSLREVNEVLGTRLESSEVETVAGWLVDRIGRIPRDGESFTFEGLRFLILSAEQVRVNKLKIERIVEGEAGR